MRPYLKRIKTITITILIIAAPFFLFAQEVNLNPKGNRGVIEFSQTPEVKKSTKNFACREISVLTFCHLNSCSHRDFPPEGVWGNG